MIKSQPLAHDPLIIQRMPELEFRCPSCPFCDEDTIAEDKCFDCRSCGISWDSDGKFIQRIDEYECPQCTAKVTPFAVRSGCQVIAHYKYRCAMNEDHATEHRGYRIDPPPGEDRWSGGDTHTWSVTT